MVGSPAAAPSSSQPRAHGLRKHRSPPRLLQRRRIGLGQWTSGSASRPRRHPPQTGQVVPFRVPSAAHSYPLMPARSAGGYLPLFVMQCATVASCQRRLASLSQCVLDSIPRRRTNSCFQPRSYGAATGLGAFRRERGRRTPLPDGLGIESGSAGDAPSIPPELNRHSPGLWPNAYPRARLANRPNSWASCTTGPLLPWSVILSSASEVATLGHQRPYALTCSPLTMKNL